MNINNSPSIAELKALISCADDEAGHHVLWVDALGEVHLTTLPADMTPVGFEASQPSMRARFGTFDQGNDYVGPGAAADEAWMNSLYVKLKSIVLTNMNQYLDEY